MSGQEYRSQKWRISEMGFVEVRGMGRLSEDQSDYQIHILQTGNLGSHN